MTRRPRDASATATPGPAPTGSPESPALPTPLRLRASGCRPSVRTVNEALQLIDRELPPELSRLPRWTFARALLIAAAKTQRKRDLNAALRQLRQALSNEGWLVDDPQSAR